jgi:hypothetical protein
VTSPPSPELSSDSAYTGGSPRQHADPTGLIDGAPCTWWLLSCGGLDEDITGSTAVVAVNFGRGATGGLTDTIANRISPGASCTIDNTSLPARTSQALGFTATMLPASITTGGAAAATRNTTTTRTTTETASGAEKLIGESRTYVDLTRGGSVRNIGTDATHSEFTDTLTSSGWISRTSKDGAVQILQKDGAKYVLREKAGSYSGWSADFTPAGSSDVALKIRLGYQP